MAPEESSKAGNARKESVSKELTVTSNQLNSTFMRLRCQPLQKIHELSHYNEYMKAGISCNT